VRVCVHVFHLFRSVRRLILTALITSLFYLHINCSFNAHSDCDSDNQLWGSGGQRSGSQEVEVRFGGLAEAGP